MRKAQAEKTYSEQSGTAVEVAKTTAEAQNVVSDSQLKEAQTVKTLADAEKSEAEAALVDRTPAPTVDSGNDDSKGDS